MDRELDDGECWVGLRALDESILIELIAAAVLSSAESIALKASCQLQNL